MFMTKFKIDLLLEKGKINVKGLLKILRKSEDRFEDIESAIGDEETSESILGRIKVVEDIGSAIGDEETPESILGRIKALEDANNVG